LAPLCRDYCLYAGISSPTEDIHELHIAYLQAEVALNQAFRLRNDRWILPFQDCVLDYLAAQVESPMRPVHLVSPDLLQLMDHDQTCGTQFFETLKTYLQLERDIPKTAQALIIHRTTLLYRLKKIQQLINLNLDDSDQRLYLMLSLWLLEKDPHADT
jgi:DNA-binding PucR family transcriptional regulator